MINCGAHLRDEFVKRIFVLVLAGMLTQAALAQASDAVAILLRRGGFDSAITSGTTFQAIYRKNGDALLFYTNRPPTTGHENRRIIVMKNGRYAHDYDAGDAQGCRAMGQMLICHSGGHEATIWPIKLVDVFAGKTVLVGGDLAVAYRGKVPLRERDHQQPAAGR
jgi:hypothetical protein